MFDWENTHAWRSRRAVRKREKQKCDTNKRDKCHGKIVHFDLKGSYTLLVFVFHKLERIFENGQDMLSLTYPVKVVERVEKTKEKYADAGYTENFHEEEVLFPTVMYASGLITHTLSPQATTATSKENTTNPGTTARRTCRSLLNKPD